DAGSQQLGGLSSVFFEDGAKLKNSRSFLRASSSLMFGAGLAESPNVNSCFCWRASISTLLSGELSHAVVASRTPNSTTNDFLMREPPVSEHRFQKSRAESPHDRSG